VSLRPVREDLAAAGAAVEALVRVLGGGVPTATTDGAVRHGPASTRQVAYRARVENGQIEVQGPTG